MSLLTADGVRVSVHPRYLTRLRTHGFRPLRLGHIHLRCPSCGRKQSNSTRDPEYDHPTAFLAEILCDKCDAGTKDAGAEFFDRRGRLLDSFAFYERRNRTAAPAPPEGAQSE